MVNNNHIQCGTGDIGKYVLLPGDPARCSKIANYFDDPHLVAQNREFTTYTGFLCEEKVSVTSTGIGCPSTAIAVEELAAVGADTFIRVGTCGGLQPWIALGDLIIFTAAVRDEGTSQQYIPLAYPAVADFSVTNALFQAGTLSGQKVHMGIGHSKDSFFGQQQPKRMPIANVLQNNWTAWKKGNVLGSEMESAALFVIASILGKRAGAVMLVSGNQERKSIDIERDTLKEYSLEPLIITSINAIKKLIHSDKIARKN